ncbi:hypothetical protein D3C80_754970 [compost metagenome]
MEHAIRREADTGYHVGRGEGGLLHVGEVVVRVLVELQHPHRDQRVVAVRPHLGEVERVDFVGLGLGLRHHLHIDLPAREVAPLDGVVEIRLTGLPILADGGGGLFICVEAVALLCLEVELDPEALVGVVDEAEGVAAVAVHLPQAPGDAAIAEQYGDLMQGLRMAGPEVPGCGGAAQVGARIPLLGVDEIGEFQRIADEEDGGVVPHQIPVALLGVELEGEAAYVALGVGGALLTGHGGEAQKDRGLLADGVEQVGLAELADVVGHGKGAVGARALGVNHPLGNALAVEVGEFLHQPDVLHQHRAAGAGGEAVVVVDDGGTVGAVQGLVSHGASPCDESPD